MRFHSSFFSPSMLELVNRKYLGVAQSLHVPCNYTERYKEMERAELKI